MNYTWIIEQLWVKPVSADLTDVVVTAAWRCNGTDGTYSDTVYGTCSFAPPSESSFTPYLKLKPEQILGWCWSSGVDKDGCEANVAQKIENQINPPIITPPLPWNPPAPEPEIITEVAPATETITVPAE